jgi:patatin-related protein
MTVRQEWTQRTLPKEEIRFAVVLNGGASMAVWMGGVVTEIDAVTRGRGTYGRLLDLLDLDARADVIAGTSAGGINGAALALSQANELADVSKLRDLWAEQGRMDSLLQQPFRGSPASLLRGDDYFLPKLYEALRRLTQPWRSSRVDARPVDLTITTTLLNGARTVSVDSLGQQLPQREHDGQFRFVRGEGGDDFNPDADPELAARLAIAARCSAGFPVAFEPCFVPAFDIRSRSNSNLLNGQSTAIGNGQVTGPHPNDGGSPRWQVSGSEVDVSNPLRRPDLGRFVSWRDAGPADEIPEDRSRYAVDGGVLENTPTKQALDAISRMPAGGLVHRVMLLVYPHAPANVPDPADRPDEPPAVTSTLGSVLGALLSQTSRTFVNEVEDFNRASASRRGTRHDVLETAGGPDGLWRLAGAIFENYRRLRIRRAARDLAKRFTPPTNWSYERIRQAAEDAQNDWLGQTPSRPLPYVPVELPGGPPGAIAAGVPGARWAWGVTSAIDLSEAAIDLLDLLIGVVPADGSVTVANAREQTCVAQASLRRVRDRTDDVWTDDPVLARLQPSKAYWSLRLAYYARVMLGEDLRYDQARQSVLDFELEEAESSRVTVDEPGPAIDALRQNSQPGVLGQQAAEAVRQIVDAIGSVLHLLSMHGDALPELRPWRELLTGVTDRTTLYNRLLWLHVATWTIADESPTEASLPIDLIQVSLQTANPFATYSTTPDDKVGGLSLRRFGGFLKRSWRMNDWTWGRIDAATMLCQIILSPQRLRRRIIQNQELRDEKSDAFTAADAFVTRLVDTLFGQDLPTGMPDPGPPGFLAGLRQEAADELTPLYWNARSHSQLPRCLPKLAAIAAWAVHIQVAMEELPTIANAVRDDRGDRANRFSRGELFVEQYADLLRSLQMTRTDPTRRISNHDADLGLRALDAFDRAGIGREPLAEEARSDQMIRTAATAASVAVTVADSPRSGLSAIKPVTRTLRGGMLIPYWTILGLAASGTIVRFLALWFLGTGAVLLALPLLGVLHGWAAAPATAIGVAALLTAFGFAAMRTGTLLHSIVLLTPVIPLLAFAAERWHDQPDHGGQAVGLGTIGTILALTLTLTLLGSMPGNLGTPLASLYNALDRTAQRYTERYGIGVVQQKPGARRRVETLLLWLSLTVVKVVAVVATIVLLTAAATWANDRVGTWTNHRGWLILIATAVTLLGWILGYWAGWCYRLWSDSGDGAARRWRTRPVNMAEATAATWAVIYGTVFVVIATWVIWHWPAKANWAWQAALATAVVFAIVLLYVVPVMVLVRTPRVLRRRLCNDVQQRRLVWPRPNEGVAEDERRRQQQAEVAELLHRKDLGYRYLIRAKRPVRTADQARVRYITTYVVGIRRPVVTEIELTKTGCKLAERVTKVVPVDSP